MRSMIWKSVLACGLAGILAWAGSALAAERLTIEQLHKYHRSYHMRSVTVVGKVEELLAYPPTTVGNRRCRMLYGRAKFVLVDATGSLQVENMGTCFPAAMNVPLDGDQIELTAQIQVYVPEGQTAEVIKAITQEIVVLK